LKQAVLDAKRLVHRSLQAAAGHSLGKGAGPVDLLHAVRKALQRR